ncbi:DUF2076 domain-containing protein [Methylomagnum sp.]
MNSEERRLLTDFLDQMKQARGFQKDPDAAALISAAAAQQPDAAYLLVQKALLQEQALNAAKSQIAQLQGQLEQARARSAAPPRSGGGFLGGSDPWAAPAPTRPAPAAPWAGAAPQAPASGGGFGSFLGTAAAAAAGIAGGAFLFQGLESLLGGHHNSGSGFLDSADINPDHAQNVTINEYYGSDDNQPDQDTQDNDFDPGLDDFDTYDDDDGSLSV